MNIVLSGYGKMGHMVEKIINDDDSLALAGIRDVNIGTFGDIKTDFDVIIDFSHPDFLGNLLDYAVVNSKPLVVATTGYTDAHMAKLAESAEQIPIVYSANYSLGINIMERVLKEITPILKDSFDMEIIEKHHNRKLDSPSGTAKMLAAAMNPEGEFQLVYGRNGMRKREKEIGVHAVRGGTVAGEHVALYAGDDEIIEIKHNANSRKIFAVGAIKAAQYIVKQDAGLYSMTDVLFGGE